MKIDLCKIFGVEEGEEFRIEHRSCIRLIYKVQGNSLMFRHEENEDFQLSNFGVNTLLEIENVIKLPKRKEFTDDELCIFRAIPKDYEWCARDNVGTLFVYKDKPIKNETNVYWYGDDFAYFGVFNHLFQSITSEDEEPVCIEDYVER